MILRSMWLDVWTPRMKNRMPAAPGGFLSISAEALTTSQILNYSADVDYSKIITIDPGKAANPVFAACGLQCRAFLTTWPKV
jgi:hypothetical protein